MPTRRAKPVPVLTSPFGDGLDAWLTPLQSMSPSPLAAPAVDPEAVEQTAKSGWMFAACQMERQLRFFRDAATARTPAELVGAQITLARGFVTDYNAHVDRLSKQDAERAAA